MLPAAAWINLDEESAVPVDWYRAFVFIGLGGAAKPERVIRKQEDCEWSTGGLEWTDRRRWSASFLMKMFVDQVDEGVDVLPDDIEARIPEGLRTDIEAEPCGEGSSICLPG